MRIKTKLRWIVVSLSLGYPMLTVSPTAWAVKKQTVLDQGSNKEDIELTRALRQEITAADELSVQAKNIKIITHKGMVTLRGEVLRPEEREKIVEIAEKHTSPTNINNQITVKTTENH